MDISVIVITLGRLDLLEACLASLDRAVGAVRAETEIIVVLNGTDDILVTTLAERADPPRLVALGRNEGFAAGVNAGLRRSSGRWVALVNDDAEVDRDFLAQLLPVADAHDELGSVAGQLRFHHRPDLINSAGIVVDRLGVAADRFVGQPVGACGAEVHDVFGACGGAALYRRSMLDELGGFDERFFAYLEDVDLAWRARAAGWRSVHVPTAFALHHHSASSKHGSAFKLELVGRNRIRLLAKNATRRQLVRYGAAIAAYDVAFVVFVAVTERSLAPARGRIAGLREWRRFRRTSGPWAPLTDLEPVHGIRAALRRRLAWSVGAPAVSVEDA
jgi:GT2 family glycosyltransferase